MIPWILTALKPMDQVLDSRYPRSHIDHQYWLQYLLHLILVNIDDQYPVKYPWLVSLVSYWLQYLLYRSSRPSIRLIWVYLLQLLGSAPEWLDIRPQPNSPGRHWSIRAWSSKAVRHWAQVQVVYSLLASVTHHWLGIWSTSHITSCITSCITSQV